MDSMLDKIRTTLHRAIAPPVGDPRGGPLPKMLARRLNRFFGEPLCSTEELEKRRRARAKLESLRGATEVKLAREAAPVVVYFEKDRNQRLLERVEELLKARSIVYRTLDVTGDEPTMAFVMREAKCEEDDLPIVYVAGTPIGGYNDLVDWDVSGKLRESVFGS
jgi:glutaredoxin